MKFTERTKIMNKFSIEKTILTMLFLLASQFLVNAQTVAVNSNQTNSGETVIAREKSSGEAVNQNTLTNSPTTKAQNGYIRPSANARFKRYLNNTVGTGLIGVGVGAGLNQIAEVPPEWKRNGNGFARRFASAFGENAIQETVAFGLEEAFKLDSKFYKSKKRDFGSRLKNGLLSGFTARTSSGKRVFNPSPIVGAYAANVISTETWYPKRYNYKDGLRQGTQTVAFSAAFGLLNEFLFNRK
jgi:hypothetical protein